MKAIFNDFDRFLEPGFGRPTKIVFNTNKLLDMNPAIWNKTKDGNGYEAIVKTLGLEKVDISVEEYGIGVFGEGELFGKRYDTTIELPIASDVMDNIIEIKYETKAGITYIELILERQKRKEIKISEK